VLASRDALLLVVLGGALLLAGLGATALTDRDEGANAAAAREMLEQGSWVTPTLDYTPRFAKPAFVYWLMAGAYRVLGVGEAAARLPAAVSALALVLLQYAFARWALGAEVARRAALILLLSVEFVALGRMALTDATLAFWTTAAAYAFLRGWLGPLPRDRWYALAWIAAGFAVLTKGPVGLLVPLAGVVTYLAIAGRLARAWREVRVGRGLLLFLAVAAPWYAAMLWLHGADYAARARGETVGRLLRTVTGPGGTVLFYVPVLLLGFFPWSAFLPGALAGALRQARARAHWHRAGAVVTFAAAWVVAGLVLFSLARTRLPHYVLPLFPPAALLVAATWPARPSGGTRRLLASLALVLAAALVGARLASGTLVRLLAPAYPAAAAATVPAAALVGAGLLAAMGLAARLPDGARLFRALAVLAVGLLGVAFHAVIPAFSAQFVAPAAELAERARRLATPCDRLVAVGPYRPSFLFYARGSVLFLSEREMYWLAEQPLPAGRLFVVAPAAAARALPPPFAGLPPVDARGGYVLLETGLPGAGGCRA
jgi:4-amino-4-deoxy-L-arabinose transferase-like glycosyltransferase